MLTGLVSCGYAPIYGGDAPEARLWVEAAPHHAPHPHALQAVLSGARAELSRAGALASAAGHPQLVIELLRIDELSAGIAATPSTEADPQSARIPLARGASVAVVGRGWVMTRPDGPADHDTGDMRRVEHFASTGKRHLEAAQYTEAVHGAARELGRALARRVLGEPEPANEPL
jgi:hypothetical protein